jgi:hypothetical protein
LLFGQLQHELATVRHDNVRKWAVVLVDTLILEHLHDLEAIDNPTEHDVLPIQMGTWARDNEELRSVCVGPAVGHGHQEGLVVAEAE